MTEALQDLPQAHLREEDRERIVVGDEKVDVGQAEVPSDSRDSVLATGAKLGPLVLAERVPNSDVPYYRVGLTPRFAGLSEEQIAQIFTTVIDHTDPAAPLSHEPRAVAGTRAVFEITAPPNQSDHVMKALGGISLIRPVSVEVSNRMDTIEQPQALRFSVVPVETAASPEAPILAAA